MSSLATHETETRPERARDLAAQLARAIRGEVRFDDASRALYAHDLSVYRHVPIGVVVPRDVDDVIATVAVCREHEVPIFGRGCGTSLAGQCCNAAVVIDFSKHVNRILEINPDERYAWVEPGVICDQLRDAAERHHLTFAPDPATHEYCTLGGMIGNNSCGAHSIMGGKTDVNVLELDVLTYDGERFRVGATSDSELDAIIASGGARGNIYGKLAKLRDRYADEIRARFPPIPRRVSGYNLEQLLPENGFHVARALVGSESTCVLVLRAKVKLMPSPAHRVLLVIGYSDAPDAADHVPEILDNPLLALECVDRHVIENMRRKGNELPAARDLPDGHAWLLAEFGGDSTDEAEDKARAAMRKINADNRRAMKLFTDPREQDEVWKIREAGVAASRIPHVEDAWPTWEDSAVPPERLGAYLRELMRLLARFRYVYTLFGHFGQGCIHCRICFDLGDAAGVARFRSFLEQATDLVVSFGGSISGEHGDGQRAELLPRMFGPTIMQAFTEFKSIFDPRGRMNPGKVVHPYPLDRDLRVGPDYHRRPVATWFRFPHDGRSMAAATERCFGVGKCRSLDGGTMCPSFKATREEKYTTRGRAHLLFEMLRGDAIHDGWRNEEIKDALDLCLACKGCKGDCPVAVDMATYKAEFLAHHYEGRLRPRSAYALGLVAQWSRLASHAPSLVNLFTQTPMLARAVKAVAGVAPERELPAFAPQTFREWFVARGTRSGGKHVVLWPDTFNNHFEPHTAQAAVEVLEAAGCRVTIPSRPVCCGRPLYDYGMLSRAQRQLRDVMSALQHEIDAGVPIVCLEPSCTAVFRDELVNLFPDDAAARKLSSQVHTLAEFLGKLPGYKAPSIQRKALVHAHCHEKALIGNAAQAALCADMGLEARVLDSGCCGVAGSFGYEHYDVSMRIGEHALLPAVRGADKDTLIIADGFSCRSQIEHATDRRAMHLAQVLRMAQDEQPQPVAYPEQRHTQPRLRAPSNIEVALAASLAFVALSGLTRMISPRAGTSAGSPR